MHVDEYIADRNSDPHARAFLEMSRRAAYRKDREWLSSHPLFCTYLGQRFRCTGASRLGDVWLTTNFNEELTYEIRVDVAKCSNWGKEA